MLTDKQLTLIGDRAANAWMADTTDKRPVGLVVARAIELEARRQMKEEAAALLENGRFLHDDAPDARLGRLAAKAIRALPDAPKETRDA